MTEKEQIELMEEINEYKANLKRLEEQIKEPNRNTSEIIKDIRERLKLKKEIIRKESFFDGEN